MHNNLKFRVGALVLGVTLAVSGSAFKPAVDGELYAKINGHWENINTMDPSDYSCDGVTDDCTARFLSPQDAENGDYVEGSLQSGEFTPVTR